MNTVAANFVKNTRHRNNVWWLVVGIFMTISFAGAIAGSNWFCLAIAFAPFLIYFISMRPFAFLFGLYCFLIPFDSILVITGEAHGTTITKLLGIASMIMLFMSGLFEKKLMKPDKIVIWWGLFVAFGVVSIFWAVKPEIMYPTIPTALGLFMMYLIISSYKIDEKDFEMLKKIIIYGGVAASIYTIASYFFGGVTFSHTQRAVLASGQEEADPNLFAYSLLIPFALSMNYAVTERKKPVKVFALALLGVIAFAILISGSRGALLGVVTIVLTFLSSRGKKHLLIPTIVVSCILLYFAPDMVLKRISQSVETGGAGRLDIWGAGIDALKYYWASGYHGLVGIGLADFPTISSRFGPASVFAGRASHNIYLCVVIELGIMGFLLMIIAIFKHYSLTIDKHCRLDSNAAILRATLFGLMISAFFLDVIWKKPFWLIWMLIVMCNNLRKAKSYPAEVRRSHQGSAF